MMTGIVYPETSQKATVCQNFHQGDPDGNSKGIQKARVPSFPGEFPDKNPFNTNFWCMLKHVKTTAASQWPMIIGQ